jgi:cytochrome c-type biogenesis protein CcmH/NrfG
MSKATEKYKEAIVLFEEVLKYDPENKNASKYIDLSKENVKRFEDYKKSIGR